MRDKVGDEQVLIWRRSFDIAPPPLDSDSPWNVAADRRYANVAVPATESLKDTIERVLPYWDEAIAPALRSGDRVLIAAHGNSIRALVKLLSNVGDQDIVGVEIPTGEPLVYELDDDLTASGSYYLSDR
jgi:2,3-bisphosphoglycerate-dependent phosphoglycerate mutase